MLKLQLASDLSELSRLATALRRFAVEQQIAPATLHDLNLVLEELFVNVVKYGDCKGTAVVIEVESQSGNVTARIADHCRYFNPLNQFSDDVAETVDAWRVGGLGIRLVSKLSDEATYVRDKEQNIMTIKLNAR